MNYLSNRNLAFKSRDVFHPIFECVCDIELRDVSLLDTNLVGQQGLWCYKDLTARSTLRYRNFLALYYIPNTSYINVLI